MQNNSGEKKLFIIPTPIAKNKENLVLPQYSLDVIKSLDCFIVEKVQTAQSFFQWMDHPQPLHKITFRVLNKKTPDHEAVSFLKLLEDESVGLMSEAGAPGVADPGSTFIKLVHGKGIPVIPLVGPSSILLALMASGLNGQKFSFHGYLPLDNSKRHQKIQELEKDSLRTGFTHIFMETTHRNHTLYTLLLETLRSTTKLCVAANLTSNHHILETKNIKEWRDSRPPELRKIPALFLINAQ